MGRIRSIKPEILEDDKTANLPHLEWRLFVSLWLLADDYGNLRGEAGYVQGAILWALPETRKTVQDALDHLDQEELIRFYRVRGQLYIHIVGWGKHQKVDKPGKPRMPGPHEQDPQAVRSLAGSSKDSRETLATDPDLRPPIRTTTGRGEDPDARECSRELIETPPPPEPSLPRLVTPAQRTREDLRRRLFGQAWQHAAAQHAALKLEGVDPHAINCWSGLPANVESRALFARIDELLVGDEPDVENAKAVILNRIDVAAAEARRDRTMRWFTPTAMWNEQSFAIGKNLSPLQAAQPRASPRRQMAEPADSEFRRIKTL